MSFSLNKLPDALTKMHSEMCFENNKISSKEFCITDENNTKVSVSMFRNKVTHLLQNNNMMTPLSENDKDDTRVIKAQTSTQKLFEVKDRCNELPYMGYKPIIDTAHVSVIPPNEKIDAVIKNYFQNQRMPRFGDLPTDRLQFDKVKINGSNVQSVVDYKLSP